MLRVRLLGEFSVEVGGVRRPGPAGRPGALLAWLALHPGLHARRALAGRFWPDVLDESARASLRTALHTVREALGAEAGALVATRDLVGLEAWVDTREFGRLVGDDPGGALAVAGGELLEGRDDEWVHAARDEHRDAEVAALLRMAETTGDVGWSRRAVERAPLSEPAARDLMQRLAAQDDGPGALVVYNRLADRLRRELGVAPSAATREAAAVLRRPARPAPVLPHALARSYRSPLVGRSAALAALRADWARATAGERGVVVLVGEPGIGKTRLAGEFAREAFAAGAHVLYGRAQLDPLVPFQPLAEALRFTPAELVPGGDTSDPVGARYRLFAAVAERLDAAAADRPVLLVLDDLHWADRPTAMLIEHLATGAPAAVLVLGTCRDGDLELIADLTRAGRLTLRHLGPVGATAVAELATAWDVPPHMTGELAARTGGNPFFVEELSRHVGEGGSLAGVPEGVKAVIGQRLRRLGDEARDTLALAAVAGGAFTADFLSRCGGGRAVAGSLDAAVGAQLLRPEPRRPGEYAFAHALVRDAIYEALPPGRRAALHAQVARTLEAITTADPEPHLPELARHFRAAGRPGEAVAYARRAARRAVEQLAYEDAARQLEAVLDLIPDRTTQADVQLALGEARLRAGDTDGSRRAFGAAAELARDVRAPQALARAALGRSGFGVTVLGHDPETVALLEEAAAGVGEEDAGLRAQVLGRLAIELYHASVYRREQLSAHALELARRAGDPAALSDALSARHVALWAPKHLDERLRLAEELVATAPDPERALQGHNWRVLDLLEAGDIAVAEAAIAEHGRLADELRLPGFQWWAPMWQAMLTLLRGEFAAGERLAADAMAIGRRAADRVADLFAWIQSTYLAFEREPVLEPTVPDRMAVFAVQSALRADLPLLYAEAGRTDAARAELDALAADDFAAVTDDMNHLAGLAGLARGARVLGDDARMQQLYERLLPYRDRAILIGRGAVCLGPAELYLGILSGSDEHFDAAAGWARTHRARPWQAWIAHWRGDHATAREIATELGMGRLLGD